MALLDFNSLVVCNYEKDTDTIYALLKKFKGLGVKNFIVTYYVNYHNTTPNNIIEELQKFKQDVKSIHISGIKVKVCPVLNIRSGLVENPFIRRLKVYGRDAIFVTAPTPIQNRDWINSSFHHLVFKKNLIPVFASYEENIINFPNSFTDSLFKAANVMFCLDLNFFLNPNYEHLLHKSVTNKTTIIPCVSNSSYSYSNIELKFQRLRKRIGDIAYLRLCKQINTSCERLWK